MKHFCGGEIIFLREDDVWYCQRCGVKHYAFDDFVLDNQAEKMELK